MNRHPARRITHETDRPTTACPATGRSAVSTALVAINLCLALVSAGFAAFALARPAALAGPVGPITPSGIYYAQLYASRALPLGVGLAGLLAVSLLPGHTVDAWWLLLIAGAAQLGDAAIGIRHRIPGMIAGGSMLAVVHLASAAALR